MRHPFLLLMLAVALSLPTTAEAQKPKPGDIRFFYTRYDYGDTVQKSEVCVYNFKKAYGKPYADVVTMRQEGVRYVPGYASQEVSYDADSISVSVQYDDSAYFYRTALRRSDIEWRTEGPSRARRYTCSINSNTLVFTVDETFPHLITPLPHYGLTRGLLTRFERNGQKVLELTGSDDFWHFSIPQPQGQRRVTPRELDRIVKERLVVSTRLFDSVQLHWGEANAGVDRLRDIPFDTVLHYAGGTLALRRVKIPVLPEGNYQHFIELHQRSAGDAYDRTGSLFVVLPGRERSFFDGICRHPDSLPALVGRDGERYQGVARTAGYVPPLELVRFFTPFGVGHFNERMADFGIDWRGEAYYRQEITDLYPALGADALIGIWIGNYDGGGHRVTVDLKSYPNDEVLQLTDSPTSDVIPLFNTCNVLEMAGQNYGKLFATDSLTVSFTIPSTATGARLRYISTGHGGWGGGDEFVPKTNTLLVDGHPVFTHTPWREDCGTFRDLNPVSGNFWNGLSSSDFSRSGWCPGTATQPVWFDLTPWADGQEHTLTIAIPQGQPVEGMFSHWAVSGALVVEY